MLKLGVIGCGNMAEAIVKGILKKGKFAELFLNVFDVDKNKSKRFESFSDFVKRCDSYEELLEKSEYVLLAVKPQNFTELFSEIKNIIKDKHILISIAAGVSIKKIETFADNFGKLKIVRIMPNTPALVFKGMSALCFNELIEERDKSIVTDIFETLGKTIILDETKMNAVTAVSGSGPAYLFYFAECYINAAKSLGFDSDSAKTLVYATIDGASKLMTESADSAEELRRKVTSPGGTTEAAIKNLMSKNFENILTESITAAKIKADELGKK
ncbi:MAG TPA: pyrroline-5-carboxylate reductase [bacterium]|nr:pyrroline-5-carboxylate reductase [bacterium]HPN30699.1 pyrroline-5-carboxylate reductase [bacterium]